VRIAAVPKYNVGMRTDTIISERTSSWLRYLLALLAVRRSGAKDGPPPNLRTQTTNPQPKAATQLGSKTQGCVLAWGRITGQSRAVPPRNIPSPMGHGGRSKPRAAGKRLISEDFRPDVTARRRTGAASRRTGGGSKMVIFGGLTPGRSGATDQRNRHREVTNKAPCMAAGKKKPDDPGTIPPPPKEKTREG